MKKILSILIAILLLGLSACGSSTDARLHRNELLAIDDSICTWAEAQMYILSQHTIYSQAYGEGIWAVKLAEGSFEKYVKDALLDYLKLLFLADLAAKKQAVQLSEAEKNAVRQAAASFMQALGEEAAVRTGITEEIAEAAYTRYAMAQIFYRQTVTDIPWEISDEEARVISLEIVEIDPRQGYGVVKEISELLQEGKTVSEALRGREGVSSRRENIHRGTYSEGLEAIAFSLKTDQWSPVITEDTTYYMLHCLSSFVEDDTAIYKAQMERAAREAGLDKALRTFAASAELLYNPDLWNSWSMSSYQTYPAVSFFDYSAALEK